MDAKRNKSGIFDFSIFLAGSPFVGIESCILNEIDITFSKCMNGIEFFQKNQKNS